MAIPKNYIALVVLHVTLISGAAWGQVVPKADSVKLRQVHITNSKFVNSVLQKVVNSMKKGCSDNCGPVAVDGKSEDAFLPYENKIIRKIYIDVFNFDRSFYDTAQQEKNLITRIGKRLHYTTKRFVIRDNLFIKENTPLNAYKVADNERYLRTLEYIQDARIIVSTVDSHPDSVDIFIFTKDFFSIAGGAASQGLNRVNANLYDANLAGMGQRLEVSGLYDFNRQPQVGYGGLYRKGNAFHTFIDASVGYSTMAFDNFTGEEATTTYVSLGKRLVSPYSRTAGGILLSRNQAANLYNKPGSLFYKYSYSLFDAWVGYSVGIRQLTATNNTIRDRRFLAFRYTNRNFNEVPAQVDKNFNPVYNSSQIGLVQATFYRQDYYKARYIYGFGTTEDIPYGYNITVTAGLQRQLNLQRPYAGFTAARFFTTGRGDFLKLYLRSGGFMYNNKVQDGSFLIGASAFTRLFYCSNFKIRGFISTNYTHLYNRVTYAPLRIDNSYGLRGFLSDSAYGTRRLSLQMEAEFYLKGQILGFRFAPFPYADLALITPEARPYNNSMLYSSLGGGLRARNPNLVFETIEARAYFFPGAPNNMKGFKIIITSNIKFRYSSNYITAPDVVQLNME